MAINTGDVRGCSCGQADFGAPGHDGHGTRTIVVKATRTLYYDLVVPVDYDINSEDFSDKVFDAANGEPNPDEGETVSINAWDGYKQVY